MPYVRRLQYLRSEGYQTEIGQIEIDGGGRTFQIRSFVFKLPSFTSLFERIAKLKHLFSRKRSTITGETTREIKGFIVFIDEKGLQ